MCNNGTEQYLKYRVTKIEIIVEKYNLFRVENAERILIFVFYFLFVCCLHDETKQTEIALIPI